MILEIQSCWEIDLKDEDVVSYEFSDLPITINFRFTMKVDYTVWHRGGTRSVLLHRLDVPEEEVDMECVPEDRMRECIEEELRPTLDWWEISTNISNTAAIPISDVVQLASAQIRRQPPRHNLIHITISLQLRHAEIHSERVAANYMRPAIEREPNYMRPALESAVKGLKKSGRVSAEDRCVICQEDFEQGFQGFLTMPCSHNFHAECIKRWLGISHVCPTCVWFGGVFTIRRY